MEDTWNDDDDKRLFYLGQFYKFSSDIETTDGQNTVFANTV